MNPLVHVGIEMHPAVMFGLRLFVLATVLLMTAILATLLLRKQSAAWRHHVWTVSMIALLVLPAFTALLPNWGPVLSPSPGLADIPTTTVRKDLFEVAKPRPLVSPESPGARLQIPATPFHSVSHIPFDEETKSLPQRDDGDEPVGDRKSTLASETTSVEPFDRKTSVSFVALVHQTLWLLLVIWGSGVLIGLCTLARTTRLIRRIVREAKSVDVNEFIELMDELRRSMGITPPVTLQCSGTVKVPVTVGIVSPIVLLPTGYGKWSDGRMRIVLAHELAHIARRDVMWQMLARLVGRLYWCHPLVWLANRRMRAEREHACDDAVLRLGESPCQYAAHLVDVASEVNRQPRLLAVMVAMASPGGIEQRVRAILHPHLCRTPVTRRAASFHLILSLLLVAAVCLFGPTAKAVDAAPKVLTTSAVSENKAVPLASDTTVGTPVVESTPETRNFHVTVLDPEGKPLAGADLKIGVLMKDPKSKFKLPREFVSDEKGKAAIRIPVELRMLKLWCRKKGLVPMFVYWDFKVGPDVRIPKTFTLQLPKGAEVGGTVVDEAGNPIEGVAVDVRFDSNDIEPKMGKASQVTWLAEDGVLRTDSAGRWTLDNVPNEAGEVLVKLSHPDFIDDQQWGEYQKQQGITTDSFRGQTAKIAMRRGIVASGRITDPDGHPVPNALVVWGNDPYDTQGSQEVRTDSDGVYRFPPLPEGPLAFTVIAKGWMPDLTTVEIKPGMSPVDFALRPGKTFRVRFVDPQGKPIGNVWLSVDRWRGKKSLYNTQHPNVIDTGIPRISNDKGVYEWLWAPEDVVKFHTHKPGWSRVSVEIPASETVQDVVIQPRLTVSGMVTDAVTGKPIDRFVVAAALYFGPDNISINHHPLSNGGLVFGANGRFQREFDRTDIEHGVHIEADNYQAKLLGPWKVGDPDPSLNITLEPAEPIQCVVIDPTGRPVPDATVYLATQKQQLRIYDALRRFADVSVRDSDDQGRVTFPAQYESYSLVAFHDDKGFVRVTHESEERPDVLQLQEWAQVEGQLFQQGQVVPGATIHLWTPRSVDDDQHIGQSLFSQTTDAQGRFTFGRVPPMAVVLEPYLTVWEDFPITSRQSVPLELRPGQKLSIDLGKEGVQLTGKLVFQGNSYPDLDKSYSLNYLVALKDGIQPSPKVAASGFNWRNGWSDAWSSTSEGRAYMRTLPHYFVKLEKDGRFNISGVPVGDYVLAFKLYETPPKGGCLIQPVAMHHFPVRVEQFQKKLNLGELTVQPFHAPAEGDLVADFEFENSAGTTVRLSDYRGKYVLINAWASWCTYCVTAMPNFRTLYDRHVGDGRLLCLGLNLDRDKTLARDFVKTNGFDWNQGYLGDWQETKVPAKLGISSLPAYLLIDPQGKLVGKIHNFDHLEALLEKTLVKN